MTKHLISNTIQENKAQKFIIDYIEMHNQKVFLD